MLTQKDQRIIRSRLNNIYKVILSKKDIDYFENEIVQIIEKFNKKMKSEGKKGTGREGKIKEGLESRRKKEE